MKVINRYKVGQYLLGGALLAGYITIWPKQWRLPCPIHATTGLWCPGCGTTRALDALVHGNFSLAFHYNPLLICSPVLIYLGFVFSKSPHRKILLGIYLTFLVALVITFTVFRNLPGSPIAPI